MPTPDRPADLAVRDVRVFDGLSPELHEGAVLVSGGRITAVGPDVDTTGARRVLDGAGGTLVPGLIDAHFHAYGLSLSLLETESLPLSYVALAGARRLRRALARGFTTVRDVAGGDAGLARAVERGLVPSPRYLWTGPALSQTGGHGDVRAGHLEQAVCCTHSSEVVDGVDDLRVAVRDRLRRGAHAIKVMTSGGVTSLTDPIRVPQYSAEELQAVVGEATRRGAYVTAHSYSPESIAHSVENGITCIEHGNLLDAPTARLMADRGVWMVPTLATYDAMGRRGDELGMPSVSQAKNQEVLDSGRRAVELAVEAGVRVGFGTDLMGDLEEEQLTGLRLQAEVLGPFEALRSATSTNADLIGRPDLGRVVEGAVADLLLLDGDPLEDASVLWDGARTVVQAGLVVG
ncbi:amidohydrolase family protein [uncultured Pseudokineococcus sp.]|uniref:metal-dependent hydrolase family protein n=1 Tax=uncultured Pseudokineococcus sp. TaxID=1642928 RepID=UPI00262B4AD4|nr:amidohydrolase family protein [uncultured Pseudokineococcus sp.]